MTAVRELSSAPLDPVSPARAALDAAYATGSAPDKALGLAVRRNDKRTIPLTEYPREERPLIRLARSMAVAAEVPVVTLHRLVRVDQTAASKLVDRVRLFPGEDRSDGDINLGLLEAVVVEFPGKTNSSIQTGLVEAAIETGVRISRIPSLAEVVDALPRTITKQEVYSAVLPQAEEFAEQDGAADIKNATIKRALSLVPKLEPTDAGASVDDARVTILEAVVASQQHRLEQVTGQLETVRAERDAAEARAGTAEAKVETLTAERDAAQSQTRAAEDRATNAEYDLRKATKKITRLEASAAKEYTKLVESRKQTRIVTRERDSAITRADAAEAQARAAEERASTAEVRATSAEERAQAATARVEELEEALRNTQGTIARLSGKNAQNIASADRKPATQPQTQPSPDEAVPAAASQSSGVNRELATRAVTYKHERDAAIEERDTAKGRVSDLEAEVTQLRAELAAQASRPAKRSPKKQVAVAQPSPTEQLTSAAVTTVAGEPIAAAESSATSHISPAVEAVATESSTADADPPIDYISMFSKSWYTGELTEPLTPYERQCAEAVRRGRYDWLINKNDGNLTIEDIRRTVNETIAKKYLGIRQQAEPSQPTHDGTTAGPSATPDKDPQTQQSETADSGPAAPRNWYKSVTTLTRRERDCAESVAKGRFERVIKDYGITEEQARDIADKARQEKYHGDNVLPGITHQRSDVQTEQRQPTSVEPTIQEVQLPDGWFDAPELTRDQQRAAKATTPEALRDLRREWGLSNARIRAIVRDAKQTYIAAHGI